MNLALALQTVSEDNDGFSFGAGGLVGLLVVILLQVVIIYFVRRV